MEQWYEIIFDKKETETEFQNCLKLYRLTESQKYWEKMWEYVHYACSNIAKKLLKGVKCPDLDGKIMDATILVMSKIKEGEDPQKLSSFCYFPVFGILYDRKLQKEERTLSYEAWEENEYAKEEKNAK